MMAYRKNFVVAIKHKGSILREIDEVVTLPFGAEYSVLLKNKDSRRAVATIEIDGQDVVDKKRLIVEPNDTVELKGFMKGSTVRNKFRFIKKTKQISKYRGDRIDDGLVRVEFWFEKREQVPEFTYTHWPTNTQIYTIGSNIVANTRLGSSTTDTYKSSNFTANTTVCNDGITVKGTPTNQGFNAGYTKELEYDSTVITLKLRGASKINKKKVKKAISVTTKIKCNTCGKKSKSSAVYCSRCSTYLR